MLYLDYASTYPTYKEIIDKLPLYFENYDFNPSAVYSKAIKVKTHISDLKNNLAFLFNMENSNNLIFTSSATESINMVLKGLNYRQRSKIIVWDIEHKAVLMPCKTLEKQGVEVVFLNTSKENLSFDNIKNYLDSNTKLVSIMHINNETGALNDIKKISEQIKNFDKNILIMSDMSQSFCKVETNLENIDYAIMSGHKIGGLKGTGLLYIKNKETLSPLIEGGGQESGLRAGTENVIGYTAFDDAVIITKKLFNDNVEKLEKMRNMLIKYCKLNNFNINSPEDSIPYIFNFSTLKLPSEVLINYLSSKDIYVSSASACSGKSKSYVLNNMGFSNQIINSAIRVSFSPVTSFDEIERLMYEINKAIKELSF